MKNKPSMRRPKTPARLTPARTSAGLMLSVLMEECRRANETSFSSKFFSRLFHGWFPDGFDSNPRRPHPQPEEPEPRAAAPSARGDHRPLGLWQELARLRHAVRRGPAPLRRVTLRLRTPVPAAHGEARCRLDRRPVAGDRHRAEGGEP